MERLTSKRATLLGIRTRQYVNLVFYVDLNQNRRKVKVKGVYVDVINIYARDSTRDSGDSWRTQGTQGGTQGNSGGNSGTQGTQTTHFGELRGELRRHLPAATSESDPAAHVCCKLVLLYLDALEYLGTELTPAIISAAYEAAHAADFDAKMTRVVFEIMLKVIKRSQVKVSLPQVVLKYNKKMKMDMYM